MGSAVVPWLVRSPPIRGVRVRGLAENIVLCFWFKTLYFHIAFSQSSVWVPAKLLIGNYCWGLILQWTSIQSRVELKCS